MQLKLSTYAALAQKCLLIPHCMKSVRIRSFSGPFFAAFRLNTSEKNSGYEHFSRSAFLTHPEAIEEEYCVICVI